MYHIPHLPEVGHGRKRLAADLAVNAPLHIRPPLLAVLFQFMYLTPVPFDPALARKALPAMLALPYVCTNK